MRFKLLATMIFLITLVGCTPGSSPTAIQTKHAQPTSGVLTPKPTNTSSSQVPTAAPTQTAEEIGLKTPCQEIATKLPNEVAASGVVILKSRVAVDEHYTGGTFLLNMGTGETAQIAAQGENQIDHVVSPNRHLMAYESVIFNSEGKFTKEELVIADAIDNRVKAIPWEEEWFQTPVWSDNEHVVINLSLPPEENSDKKPLPMLVLNPFTDERRILKPDFSGFPDTPSTNLPYWEGRWGVIYDPTLTYVIYPHIIENNKEMYTYAIWDLPNQRVAATLENTFAAFSLSNYYPMPKWSPDGSQFVLQGVVQTADPVKFELYAVNRAGQAKQLTQLSSVAYIWESSFSWSPDGRHIAMFLGPPLGAAFAKARVAVLDTTTLSVKDYCVDVTFSGEGYGGGGPSSPIWSPDGKQFLVTDWYEKDHRRIILIDIEKNMAAQVAEDMEPVGWMTTP